jgi:hypothetical protein
MFCLLVCNLPHTLSCAVAEAADVAAAAVTVSPCLLKSGGCRGPGKSGTRKLPRRGSAGTCTVASTGHTGTCLSSLTGQTHAPSAAYRTVWVTWQQLGGGRDQEGTDLLDVSQSL